MTVTAVQKDPDALTMTLTAEFDASPERVWDLWADPRQLERWWGPPAYPATVEAHDLRPGGRVAYRMTGPEGDEHRGYWDVDDVQPLEIGADDLAAPDALLGDQAGPLEHGDVLLHRREAHRVVAGQLDDALLGIDRAADDVAPRGIGERAEQAVDVGPGDRHNTIIRLYLRTWQGCRCTRGAVTQTGARSATGETRRAEPGAWPLAPWRGP